MANFFQKIISGLDFWDKSENKNQRDQYARDDEEEKRRRQQQAASRASSSRNNANPGFQQNNSQEPGSIIQPDKPQVTIASQGEDFLKKQQDATIQRLKKANQKNAITPNNAPTDQPLDRTLNTVASSAARVGTGVAQGVSGLFDLVTPGKGTNRISKDLNKEAQDIDASAKQYGNEKAYKAANVAGEIASYAIPSRAAVGAVKALPKVAGVAERVADKGAELVGDATRARRAISRGVRKALDPTDIVSDTAISSKYTGEKSSKGEDISPTSVAADVGTGIVGNAALGVLSKGVKSIPRPSSVEIAPGVKSTNIVKEAIKEDPTPPQSSFLQDDANVTQSLGDPKKTDYQYNDTRVRYGLKKAVPALINTVTPNELMDAGTKTQDSSAVLVNVLANTNDKGRARNLISRILPDVQGSDLNSLANQVSKIDNPEHIKQILDQRLINNTPSSPTTPNPENPITLAKAQSTPTPTPLTDNNAPIAYFSQAVKAMPKRAENVIAPPEVPGVGINQVTPEGNPSLVSDMQAQKDLQANGVVNQPEGSVVAANEQQMQNATQKTTSQEVGNTAAPRTRARAADLISDDELRSDVIDNFPGSDRLNIEDTQNAAKAAVNDMSDEQLIASFSNPGTVVESPEDFFRSVNSIRRLEQINTPESQNAVRNAIDALSEYSSRSGRNLRTTQILFEDMPSSLKVDYLSKKLANAGKEMSNEDRSVLLTLIEQADTATDNLRVLQDEARNILDSGSINNQSSSPAIASRVAGLKDAIAKAQLEKETRQGDAWRFYENQLPKGSTGKQFGDTARTLMLSSPSGRGFDILSTGATAGGDILTKNISGLLGKAVNLAKEPGTVADTFVSPRKLIQGAKEGLTRVKQSFQGKDHVGDFLGEAQKATRGDISAGNGSIRRAIRTAVELPTNLTKGIENDELYRQGMMEAAQQGLRGSARKTYAELRTLVPSEKQLRQAQQEHLKTNMLHDNGVSRFLTKIANTLEKGGGGWAGPFIRNQVAPFTSWLGGNLHRTFTDKNVLYNVGSAVNNARKGNVQGVVDDVAKFASNSIQAYAAGALLTQSGVLTTTDANGNDYAGLYFHVGDRYIPVAAAGAVSVPIILGNALQQGLNADSKDSDFGSEFLNSLTINTLKNAGVSSVFGGENNLQSTIADLASGRTDVTDTAAKYAGDLVRQYIPAFTADINSLLDRTSLNPTGEAANTKVTGENPDTGRQKTNVVETEINKTLNRIPIASQGLERKEGSNAQDFVDRVTKGSQDNQGTADNRDKKESLAGLKSDLKKNGIKTTDDNINGYLDDGDYDKAASALKYKLAEAEADPNASESSKDKIRTRITEAELKRDDVPITDDAIKARTEDGDYDHAIKGLNYQLDKIEGDRDVPDSKKQKIRDEVTRLQITQEGKYSPELVKLYSGTSLTEWRAMADPENDAYDPELAKQLQEYDKKLANSGVSNNSSNSKKTKYYDKNGGSGGSGKGKSAKKPKIITSIANQDFSAGGGFTPIKAQAAAVGLPQSAIPAIQRVPNNDRSKAKKISVSRGGIA